MTRKKDTRRPAPPPKKRGKNYGTQPATQNHREWPVSDEDLEQLGDLALDEPAMGMEPDENLDIGGPEGFQDTVAEFRERAARLAAEVPTIKDVLSARRKKAFLMRLAVTGNIGMACAAAGWSRGIPQSLRKADKEFDEQWRFALENAGDVLEAAAFQRAVHGVQEDVWHKPKEGTPEVIGHTTRYSDKLLEVLLKGNRPEKFNPSQNIKVDAGSKGGVLVVPAAVPLDEWCAAAARQQAQFREAPSNEE